MKDLKIKTAEGVEIYLIKANILNPDFRSLGHGLFSVKGQDLAEHFDRFSYDYTIGNEGKFIFQVGKSTIYVEGELFKFLNSKQKRELINDLKVNTELKKEVIQY